MWLIMADKIHEINVLLYGHCDGVPKRYFATNVVSPQHKAGFINADLVSCNITLQLCITIIARNAVLKRLMTTRALARLLCA